MDVNEYHSLVHNTQKPMKCELVNHFITKHHKPIFYEKKTVFSLWKIHPGHQAMIGLCTAHIGYIVGYLNVRCI